MTASMMPFRGEHRTSVHSNGYTSDHQSQVSSEETTTFVIEHLATFTVSKESGIVYPNDGMRRLLQLEKANGIWSQKMQMRLDHSWVMIMDYETGTEMEKFPVPLIQEPTAFTSHDPMEIYNNILVFIVGPGPGQRQAAGRSEMHIFQCQSVSAQQLAEDLKLLRAGKLVIGASGGRRHIPPPPATPPPEPPLNGVSVREQVSVFNAAAHHTEARTQHQSEMGVVYPRDGASVNDETSSTSSEKYERDVTILNHCFDDIEKFIAKLQHASAASRELERRRRNRKSKKKDMGDGMLSMRAKPPPEADFIDIFQKFKLSFNLLAKLKAHIHDPNAPELVHFLFTPLALIVDASHDTHYGPNLPAKVVSPLLTREAINLLINCVTSKETELWHSLGDAWLVPRDQWKGFEPPYHPLFTDGWSPEHAVSDERENPVTALSSIVASEAKRTRGDEIRAAQQEAEMREQQYKIRDRDDSHYNNDYLDFVRQDFPPMEQNRLFGNRIYGQRHERYGREDRERSQTPPSEQEFLGRDVSSRSDISADSIERNGGPGDQQLRFERVQHHWLEELRSRGAKIVQVTYPRTANNDKELTVIRGEYLEILDDSRKWWKARNSHGQVAHVPHTIVSPYSGTEQNDIINNPLYAQGFDRQYPNQESMHESHSPGHELSGAAARSPPTAPVDWVRQERLGKKEMHEMDDSDGSYDEDGLPAISRSHAPPPPPPPLPPPMPPATPVMTMTKPTTKAKEDKSQKSLSRATSSQDLVHEELKQVLSVMKEKRTDIDIVKTPNVFINENSSPTDIQDWLKLKAFSDKLCKQFNGMNGRELFSLKRDQLEKFCGTSEGHRLFSQLTIQKITCGFKTIGSKELSTILKTYKKKIDG